MRYMLRWWCGPVVVAEVVSVLGDAGHEVVGGTEHIWVKWPGGDRLEATEGFLEELRRLAGHDFGIEIREAREEEP